MSLAAQIAASRKKAKQEAEEANQKEAVQNRFIAKTIMKAKKKGEPAFPSNEIESLVEIATRVVAKNFAFYPEMDYVTDEDVRRKIVE